MELEKPPAAETQGFGADIPGLGDRAVRLANLGLNVLQGNTLIRLIPGPIPDANDKAIAIARAILPKLSNLQKAVDRWYRGHLVTAWASQWLSSNGVLGKLLRCEK